jgi:hypothetical protein
MRRVSHEPASRSGRKALGALAHRDVAAVMSTLFISHSSRDQAAAEELGRRLAAQGHRSVFLDFHPEQGIPPGRDWESEALSRTRPRLHP